MNLKRLGIHIEHALIALVTSALIAPIWMLIWNFAWAKAADFPTATYGQIFTVLFLFDVLKGPSESKLQRLEEGRK